jgi:molybdate transport system substrate-binding protein
VILNSLRMAVLACFLIFAGGMARAADITVFGAASLTDALEDVARAYVAKGGVPLRFSFASSSTLARQIEAGAPGQIFASADEKWMDYLAARDLIVPSSRVTFLGNALVLIAPAESTQEPLEITSALDLAALLGPDGRLSVGDPEHVPAGRYAREALTALGLWGKVEDRLARGDNVRAALALVERGETPLGIVYSTDARQSKGVKIVGTFPADSYTPVSYPFAILKGQDNAEVQRAFDFLTGPEARKIYESHGFSLK